jgi:hypothetical protein
MAAIQELETAIAARTDQPTMFKRIIEVIEMQNNPEAWKQQYDDLVKTKIARLQNLLPEQMAMLRADWDTLVSEIRAALDERPLSPKAQELGTRWRELLTRVVGETIPAERLATHHATQEWSPQMATFVDKPVWDFMTRVLARRPEP